MDVVSLTQALVRLDSVNPPGGEAACALLLADLLAAGGFEVALHDHGPGRTSLVAGLGGRAGRQRLAFTGHLDTVPLGAAPWTFEPLGGVVDAARLYGRGSSDMKAGVAAFVIAALRLAGRLRDSAGVSLILTAGEESGCDGARSLAAAGKLPAGVGALVVGEPTSNVPVLGHKGALWLQACTRGVTAHGSMPEMGDNAIYKLAHAACALERFKLAGEHYFFGRSTLNVGTIAGGANINSVPDRATMGVDIRSVAGMFHADVLADVQACVGEQVQLEVLLDLAPVYTDAAHPWIQRVLAAVQALNGNPAGGRAASYFTDASVLSDALGGVPSVILGPGEAAMAHQTDEYCFVGRIHEAVQIYQSLILDWCDQQEGQPRKEA